MIMSMHQFRADDMQFVGSTEALILISFNFISLNEATVSSLNEYQEEEAMNLDEGCTHKFDFSIVSTL